MTMEMFYRHCSDGFTVVEMMATLVITAILAATAGTFFARLLTIQERDREEAYIREKLVDACGAYADLLSIGSTFVNTSTNAVIIKYRQETGGCSLETGLVSRVAYLASPLNLEHDTVDFNIYSVEKRNLSQKISRGINGDAPLLPLSGAMVECTISPLGIAGSAPAIIEITEEARGFCGEMVPHANFQATDAALGYLQMSAKYMVTNDEGEPEEKTVTAGRVVRLWNK